MWSKLGAIEKNSTVSRDMQIPPLGASEEILTLNYGTIAGGLIGGGNFISIPLFSSFNSYNRTKSTRIVCLFDDKFNHIKESEIPKNNFDKVNDYIDHIASNDLKLQTIFRYEDDFIWGYFSKKNKSYKLYKVN